MQISNDYITEVKKNYVEDSRNRFVGDTLYDYEGDIFHETYDRPTINKSSNDKIHEVGMGETNNLPLISYFYYGTVKLWWLIAEANDIHDPLVLEPGTVLRVPDLSSYYRDVIVAGVKKK